jgi:hypothetical protein
VTAIILVVAVSLVSGVICHMLAKHRGANPVLWGVLGVAFGPVVIPFVFLAGHKTRRPAASRT